MTREETIDKVRAMKLSPGKDTELIIALHTLIPELVESEDERIREEIVNYFKKECECLLNDFRDKEDEKQLSFYKKALAYLEKQKDAGKAIEAVDRIDKYIDEHLANAHDMKDSNPDKKYYRGWDDALGKMAGILQDVYSDEKQKEQKPAEPTGKLSRQDYLYQLLIDQLITYSDYEYLTGKKPTEIALNQFDGITYGMQGHSTEKPEERFEEAREKYQVEWSEEDEDMLNSCISSIEEAKENRYAYKETDGDTSYDREINWLKSLRSRPKSSDNWKPSEEQMEAFRSYIKDFQEKAEAAVGGWNNFDVMIRLFEQLKKLM